jgi:hypothetical protein
MDAVEMRGGWAPGSASSGLVSSGAVLSVFSLAKSDLCAPVTVCGVTGVASWLETAGEVIAILSLMAGVRSDVGEKIAKKERDDPKECESYEVLRYWGDEVVRLRDRAGDERYREW